MSATWNSARLRIISTTRSPCRTPSPESAAARRQARSAYSDQVHSAQPSPSFHRSATRSGTRRTVSRKRVATVWPATAAAMSALVTVFMTALPGRGSESRAAKDG